MVSEENIMRPHSNGNRYLDIKEINVAYCEWVNGDSKDVSDKHLYTWEFWKMIKRDMVYNIIFIGQNVIIWKHRVFDN